MHIHHQDCVLRLSTSSFHIELVFTYLGCHDGDRDGLLCVLLCVMPCRVEKEKGFPAPKDTGCCLTDADCRLESYACHCNKGHAPMCHSTHGQALYLPAVLELPTCSRSVGRAGVFYWLHVAMPVQSLVIASISFLRTHNLLSLHKPMRPFTKKGVCSSLRFAMRTLRIPTTGIFIP